MIPFPINVDTINILYGTRYDSQTIYGFYKSLKNENMDIKNSKDMIVSKVGETLYEKFFRGYTKNSGIFIQKNLIRRLQQEFL